MSREVNRLVSEGKGDIRMFDGRDHALVEEVFGYHVYNQFFLLFDPLIEKQLAVGETPCAIPFADEALSMIVRFGFTPEDRSIFQ